MSELAANSASSSSTAGAGGRHAELANLTLPKSALTHMDMLRGLSAVAVLLGHVRGPFFVDMGDLKNPSVSMRALYLLTGLGHQSVVVFFVLSGFFIGTSVFRSTSKGQWSWNDFLLRRFTRLYVVLIPALFVTLALDLCGMHVFGIDNIYSGKVNAQFIQFLDARDTLRFPSFVGNLFFLQYIFVMPYGTNSALWSLGYEFWSYVLFPLFVIAAGRRRTARDRLFHIIPACLILTVGGVDLAFYFAIWLFGAFVAATWRPLAARWHVGRALVITTFIAFLCVIAGARILHSQKITDVFLGGATAIFVTCLIARAARLPPGSVSITNKLGTRYAATATALAGFSYSLYLVHFPMVAFAHAALIHGDRWLPTPAHIAAAGGLCVVILVAAYLLSQVTERRTEAVRSWAEPLWKKVVPRIGKTA